MDWLQRTLVPMCLSLTLPHRYRPSDLSVTQVARWWFKSAPTHRCGKPHTKPSEETFSSQCKLFTFPKSTSALQKCSQKKTSHLVLLGLNHSLSPSPELRLQRKLNRSPGAAESSCRNPTLAKCGGESQHLKKVRIWSPLGLPNV